MQNIRQIWEETSKQLEKVYSQRESQNIAYLLFEDVFGIPRVDILAAESTEIDRERLQLLVERLERLEPIQYVTGVADFYGRKFKIQPGALIPRPETEELVDLIIKENNQPNLKILDIGVGSGCIAITLALELKADLFATDFYEDALSIARENASALGTRIELLKHDILEEEINITELDILVSNPPYIPESDMPSMNNNVLDYEPYEALFVPSKDPLIFYRRIGVEGRNSLRVGGRLYFEIHEGFGPGIKSLLLELGYDDVLIHQDMQGKDRMISATNSTNK